MRASLVGMLGRWRKPRIFGSTVVSTNSRMLFAHISEHVAPDAFVRRHLHADIDIDDEHSRAIATRLASLRRMGDTSVATWAAALPSVSRRLSRFEFRFRGGPRNAACRGPPPPLATPLLASTNTHKPP